MHSVLFRVFGFPIHSYGFMLALSFLFGIWLSSRRAKARGLDPAVITDVGFYIILAAIVGARLYFVVLHFEEFRGNLVDIINPFQEGTVGIGGLVMVGGLVGAIVAGLLYFNLKKQPFLPYADVIAPSVGFGIFLTRIGCFLNGCCYGAPTEGPLGVIFPAECPAGAYQRSLAHDLTDHAMHAHGTVSLYPSQLFLSVGGLAIGIGVLLAGRKRLFAGFEFYLVGLLYSMLRFAVDFTRFYGPDERLGGLSHNQVVCIALFVVFAGLILKNAGLGTEQETAGTTGQSPSTPPDEPPPADGDRQQ